MAFAFLCSLACSAYDFSVGDIRYNITSKTDHTCSVASYSYYSGDITIPATVTYNNIEYSVTAIAEEAFQNCTNLTSVTIPSSVTSIGYQAFEGCENLYDVTIPNSVKTIGFAAFHGCRDLTSVTSLNTAPPGAVDASFYSGTYSKATLYVPAESVDLYKAATCWKKFSSIQNEKTKTAINPITLEGTKAAVYDLKGHKVTSLQKGQIYISNGKKFVAK